jgi:hypothetical protein
MIWQHFKSKTEKKFKHTRLYSNTWGWQIQPGTQWNAGLSIEEIEELESLFGFAFPLDYKEMLSVINGFDRDQISIDPYKSGKINLEDQCISILKIMKNQVG